MNIDKIDFTPEYITKLDPFVHPQATVMGDVAMEAATSLWPGAVARGDLNSISLGLGVNIQDNSVIHTDSRHNVNIGDYTLVGHRAILHGCNIGRGCLIGINSTVLDDAHIGDGAQITAGCTIRGGKKIPPRALVVQKGAELKIMENKANPVWTVAGSLEYIILAQRFRLGQWGPFSPEQEEELKKMAQQIIQEIGL